jgi:4-hydroxy-tetrahydrodipicolinate reductase
MGEAVDDVAPQRGHDVTARFDSSRPFTGASPDNLWDVDVAIDFSLPSVALSHIRRYCEWEQPAVIGTTGWYDHLDEVQELVDDQEASLLYAPNFSLGIAIARRALSAVGPLINQLEDYDAFVHEMHHTKKVDSPSGTAEMLGEALVEMLDRKSYVETETRHEQIDPEALHVTSTRCGSVFGEHTVGFDGSFDRIELSHSAKSRAGFAYGAVRAAEWLNGRTGLYTLDDVLDDWLD